MAGAMVFQHLIDDCLAERVGEGGLPGPEYEAALARAAALLESLRADWRAGASPLLALPARRDDLVELEQIAADWRRRFEQY